MRFLDIGPKGADSTHKATFSALPAVPSFRRSFIWQGNREVVFSLRKTVVGNAGLPIQRLAFGPNCERISVGDCPRLPLKLSFSASGRCLQSTDPKVLGSLPAIGKSDSLRQYMCARRLIRGLSNK